jgi:cephalosporin-C deacetylase-like acetyl esterase
MSRVVLTIGILFVVVSCVAADELAVLPAEIDGAAPREMMHRYLMGLASRAADRRDAEYENQKTPEQLAAYQRRVRQFFLEQLGELPARTPLNARVVGHQARDGYRIEKVIFESQPRHYVTAILYLPDGKPPYPGVLVPCGHSANGKARDLYQRMPILLAKNGMAALCYDPIDQGERHQLLGPDGKPRPGGSTLCHSLLGVGSILLGRNTASFRIWDGMRAIDYLQSRADIDPRRIGCTGISGGGTLTSYLMALDDRIVAAAPGCYLTSMRRLMETIGPQDAEQNIHAQIAFGMDHTDYVLVRAPKPTLILTATRDYFDISGSWATFRQAKRWYTRLGFAERVDLFETDDQHGFPGPMRVASARWMSRWLLGCDAALTEVESPVARDEELWCTPRGEVMLLSGARSTYDLNIAYEDRLAVLRRALWSQADKTRALAEVRRIARIVHLEDLPQPRWEKTASLRRSGYRIDKLILRPQEGIWLPALVFVPDRPTAKRHLYVHAGGKQSDAGPDGAIEKLVRAGQMVLTVDLRGRGETARTAKGSAPDYFGPDWQDVFLAYMHDRSYLAMWAEDVLVCARFLAGYEKPGGAEAVGVTSVGHFGPAVLHAATLEPQLFDSVCLRQSVRSWSDVVRAPLTKNQLVNVVHGALRVYDLPDLAATLPATRLSIHEPLDPTGR